jgi:hypothetical protein
VGRYGQQEHNGDSLRLARRTIPLLRIIGVHPTFNHCHPFAVAEPHAANDDAENNESAHQDGDDWYYVRRINMVQKRRPLPSQQSKELIHWKSSCAVMASVTSYGSYSRLANRYWKKRVARTFAGESRRRSHTASGNSNPLRRGRLTNLLAASLSMNSSFTGSHLRRSPIQRVMSAKWQMLIDRWPISTSATGSFRVRMQSIQFCRCVNARYKPVEVAPDQAFAVADLAWRELVAIVWRE